MILLLLLFILFHDTMCKRGLSATTDVVNQVLAALERENRLSKTCAQSTLQPDVGNFDDRAPSRINRSQWRRCMTVPPAYLEQPSETELN
jgi:hypothetical protein